MPELVFFRRGEEVLRFALDRSRVVLGRGEKSDVVIPDPEVSRQQAVLSFDDERCQLQDVSGRGTIVAGETCDKAELADGTDITLGQWRAVYRERHSTSEAAATRLGVTKTEQAPRGDSPIASSVGLRVRVRHGDDESVHPFAESLTVGQEAGNDLVLTDPFLSGRHLKVTRHGAKLRVSDQQSTNGTFVGSVRVYEADVDIGIPVRAGETELTFEPEGGGRNKDGAFHGIIGKDPAIRQLAGLIERVAPSSAAVAIFGESGTGKELVARAVHACSVRADRPFIPVNCAAISKELVESELFGHEKGAFTGAATMRIGAFEEADGGSLFLDEIGELPLELQAKLLRALESGEIKRVGASRPIHVDVRLITATHRDLLTEARAGRFREDLYYRLCVIPLHLPPLRNRQDDVLALAEHFVRQFAPRGQHVELTAAAVDRLKAHAWPGNIRELRNVVHRALLLRKGPRIDVNDLQFDSETHPEVGVDVPDSSHGLTLEEMLEKLERQIVVGSLRRHQHNRERVAKELGVARSTLFKRLKEWGLTRTDESE